MKHTPPLYPARLASGIVIRPLGETDADQFFAFVNHNRAHLEQHDPFVTQFQQLADVRRVLGKIQGLYEAGQSLSCGIWDDTTLTGYFICGLNLETKTIHAGYGLAKDHQGQGIITHTGRVVLEYAFNVLGMKLAWLTCNTDNIRSIRTAELLGFTREPNILPAEPEKGIFQTQYKYIRTRSS